MRAPRTHPTHDPVPLAALQVRLRQWGQAVAVLNKCLERPQDAASANSVEGLTIDVEARV